MARYSLIKPPENYPISVEDLKRHSRIDLETMTEDDLIKIYIQAATEHIESLCGPLIDQTWEMYMDDWPGRDFIEIRKARATSATVKYILPGNEEITFDEDSYWLDTTDRYARITLEEGYSWPNVALRDHGGVIVEFIAGYSKDGADVPAPLRAAALLLAAHLYEHRIPVSKDSLGEIPFSVSALITNYRDLGV